MARPFQQCADAVERLHAALPALEQKAELLQLPPLAGREWYELLRQKLIPQLHDDAFLVVAVVGGTNIGKSVIFNHLAGSRSSATSPLASGTKHPVCLVPPGFTDKHELDRIFDGFELSEWTDSEAPLKATEAHQLAPDTVHFAVLVTVAEVAAARSVGAAVVPASVQLQLLRRARPGRLVGRGKTLKRGRRLATAEGEVYQDDRLVAKATVTFALI